MADDTRDRVVALEVKVEHLSQTVKSMDKNVTEMHELLLKAKGARYVLVLSAAVGGFISAKLAPFVPWFKG